MTAKRLMLIAYCVPPYAGAGVHRNLRLVRYLAELGWGVTVLTASEQDLKRGDPIDHSLLEKIPSSVPIERTRVVRPMSAVSRVRALAGRGRPRADPRVRSREAAHGPGKDASVWQRTKDVLSRLVSLPDAEIGWVPGAVVRGLRVVRRDGVRVLYTSGPPHSCHLVGWGLKRLTGLPWVADFRDPWSRRPWLDPSARRTWHHRIQTLLERGVVRNADRVVLNTDPARKEFASHYGRLPAARFVAIPNGYDPGDLEGVPEGPPANGTFVMTHGGSLYRKRTPRGLLMALSELIREKWIAPESIRLRFIGRCDLVDLRREVEALGLAPCVDWVEQVPHRECLTALAASDLLLLFQPGTHLQVPGKLFEYIMVRRPILALADEGATAEIIRSYDLGEVLNPADVQGIKEAVLKFYDNRRRMGSVPAGDGRALEVFQARALTRQLDSILTDILRGSGQ